MTEVDPVEHALGVLEYGRMREVIASYAATAPGKAVAMRLAPGESAEEVRRWLRQCDEMRAILRVSRVPLAGVSDVVRDLEEIGRRGRPAEPEELYRVVDLIRAGMSLRALFVTNPDAPELAWVARGIDDLPELREGIPAKIDPAHGVRDDATEKLAELRRRIEELRGQLRRHAERLMAQGSLHNAFSGGAVVVRGDRYCVPVRSEYRSWIRGPIRDRSKSGGTLYVEPEDSTLRGDELLDCLDRARDEELRVLREITGAVLAQRAALERLQELVAWIDFTHARAAYAEAFGLATPAIEDRKVLELRDARHPLLLWLARDVSRDLRDIDREAVRAKVVPQGVRLGERYRLLIVTGPNTGGKTVALKTVGLNVLLALSGVPVAAAEGSRVPFYDGVFADIGDEQSIEQSLSTFSSHLTNIIAIFRRAGERSLVLLDELGAGTDPLEGAALGEALLDKTLGRGWHVVVTTHLGSLKQYAFRRDGAENAAMEFDERSLRPTYRILLGVPGSSMALAVARRMGMDAEVLAAAERVVDKSEEPTREVIKGMERTRRRIERERQKVQKARRRAQGEREEYEELRRDVEVERETLREEMEQALDGSMRAARDGLRSFIDKLCDLPKTHQGVVSELREQVERLMVSTPLGRRRDEFARALKKGSEVFVPKFRERATVRKIDRAGRRLTVVLGDMTVEIGFDDVSWLPQLRVESEDDTV